MHGDSPGLLATWDVSRVPWTRQDGAALQPSGGASAGGAKPPAQLASPAPMPRARDALPRRGAFAF